MKIFGKEKVKKKWTFSQKGNLWRIVFAGNNCLAGETRDNEKRSVYFFSLDYKSGKVFLSDYEFEEGNYWISIEGASDDYLFLHRYIRPEMPDHKNIICIDIKTGKKVWENEMYSYLFHTNERLFGQKQKFESTEIAEISMNDGSILNINPIEENDKIFSIRDSNEDLIYENSNYPSALTDLNQDESIRNIITESTKGRDVFGEIEFIKKDNFLIHSFYSSLKSDNGRERKYLQNNLFVTDYNGKNLFSEVLNKKSHFNVPDNFFIKDNILFYIKEKKEFNALELIS